MCNLRSNITAILNCHFMYLSCLEGFHILHYAITGPRKNLTQGSTKTQPKKRMFLSYSCMLLITSFSEAKCDIE